MIPRGRCGRSLARNDARKRDNYTCQDCGLRRTPKQVQKHNKNFPTLKGRIKSLDVHHTNGLCGKKSRGYDSVKDISGLITLCHKCHYNRPEHRCSSEDFHGGRKPVVQKSKYLQIAKMRQQRFTLKEIGEKYGVSGERIRQILLKSPDHK